MKKVKTSQKYVKKLTTDGLFALIPEKMLNVKNQKRLKKVKKANKTHKTSKKTQSDYDRHSEL